MKLFMVPVVLAGLCATSMRADAMQQADCLPTSISITVLNELSQPQGNGIGSETGDVRWERAQAIAERDREYSAVVRRHDDEAYRIASPLIDAQYDVVEAEIAQVVLYQPGRAEQDFDLARNELDIALQETGPEQRPPIVALWDQLQRTDLATTLCHGQSSGEDRYQYETLKASFCRVIRAL